MMPLCTIATRSVAMRMGVALGRLAVGRPARVADADGAGQRLDAEPRLEIHQLAFGAAALDVAVVQGGDAGRVVAAIFQPLQRLDQQGRDGRFADDSDDAAHGMLSRKGLLVAGLLGGRCTSFQFDTNTALDARARRRVGGSP